MKITYFGHSAFAIEVNGKHLLVDPFISGNPAAAEIDVNNLKADYILLTHAHFDHVLDVDAIVDRTKAKIIANHEIVEYYSKNKAYEGHGMNSGGTHVFDFGKVKMVSAIHSSSFADGTYGGNPNGFVLQAGGKTVYISGDTALTMDMKLIPMFFELDAAILPIGDNFTMDLNEALVASEFIACDTIIGMHYDTMPIIEINHNEAKEMFKAKGKELNLLKIGETMHL